MNTSLLRAVAIAIAVLAVIDPVFTHARSDHPTVAVVAAADGDSIVAARVRSALADRFDVVAGPFTGANATVLVGDAIPEGIGRLAHPLIVVTPGGPRIEIERVDVPVVTPLESSVRVATAVRARNANGRVVTVSLSANGANVDSARVTATSDNELVELPFTYAPTSLEPTRLRAVASLDGTPAVSAHADQTVGVTQRTWHVLFHDARPSWNSTFVRRAIERDPRFTTASRIGATRGAASAAGRPAQLADAIAIDAMDVVVIGAPDALGAAEAAALERYMRRRGGAVVFLLDQRFPTGSPVANLIGAGEWRTRDGGAAVALSAGTRDSVALRAIEMVWPLRLPVGAEPMVSARVSRPTAQVSHPVWRSSLGAGAFVVSGALDAWRFRDASQSRFDAFWRELIASEAARSVRAIDVRLTPSVAQAGERVRVQVALRGPSIAGASLEASAGARSNVTADVAASAGGSPVALWPAENIGTFEGEFIMPATDGAVRVVSGRDTVQAPFAVGRAAPRMASGLRALAAIAASTGGTVLSEAQLNQLGDQLHATLNPVSRSEPWHPMRSAWWIVPFALLLSAEWLARRRRGLA